MAGPLSSEEIEDVVSSVRRLVSNEQKPRTLSRDLNAERLLLTPALRVVPESSPLAPLVLSAPLPDMPLPEAPPEAALPVVGQPGTDPVAVEPDTSAALSDQALEDSLAEAIAMEIDPEPLVGEGDLLDDAAQDASAPMAEDVEAEWEDEIWADPGVVSLGEAALAADEAEVLTAPVPEADQPGVGDQRDPVAQGGSDWAEGEPVPFVPLRRRAEHLAARVAAGEVVETPRSDADGDIATPVGDSVSPVPDATAPPVPEASIRPEVLTTEYLDADGMALAVLDEAALQDIVRQTLRSELQGDLGERITRNVRKLVRAEINRALLARDLD